MKKIIAISIIFLVLVNLTNVCAKELSCKTENEGSNCAVIVSGGMLLDPITPSFIKTAIHARDVMRGKGYNISDGAAFKDMMIQPLRIQVKKAITEWIPENIGGDRKIILFFIDHGLTPGYIRDGGSLLLNTFGEMITPMCLKRWLDSIDGVYSTCIIVVDACYSGNFVKHVSSENRIVITCTDSDSPGYVIDDPDKWFHDENMFSKHFLDSLEQNKSIGEAWEFADNEISKVMHEKGYNETASPQIDDNGNGYSVGTNFSDKLPIDDGHTSEGMKKDGELANTIWLGHGDSSGSNKGITQIVKTNFRSDLINRLKSQLNLMKFLRDLLPLY